MPYVENFQEFCERMGCERIHDGQRWLFENGATASDCWGFREPPTDKWKLLKAKRAFVAFKLDTHEKRFYRAKESFAQQAEYARRGGGAVPGPPPNAAEMLKKAAEVIRALRRELKDIDDQLADAPENVASRARREEEAKRQQACYDQFRAITNVQI